MPQSPPHERLSSPTVHYTQAPFPVLQSSESEPRDTDDVNRIQLGAHESEKIRVEVCSELTFLHQPFDLFNNAGPSNKQTQRTLALIHDQSGQPIVLAVANNGVSDVSVTNGVQA